MPSNIWKLALKVAQAFLCTTSYLDTMPISPHTKAWEDWELDLGSKENKNLDYTEKSPGKQAKKQYCTQWQGTTGSSVFAQSFNSSYIVSPNARLFSFISKMQRTKIIPDKNFLYIPFAILTSYMKKQSHTVTINLNSCISYQFWTVFQAPATSRL